MKKTKLAVAVAAAALAAMTLGSCAYSTDQKVQDALKVAFSSTGAVALDLSGLPLESLPRELFKYDTTRIETFQLSNCGLKALPEDFAQKFPALLELSLDGNRLRALPSGFEALRRLQVLDLSYNELEDVPEAIGKMPSLIVLNLGHNDLGAIGASLEGAVGLQNLYLGHNRRLEADDVLRALDGLKGLTYIDLSYLRLAEVPITILEGETLLELDLSYNFISALPPFASASLVRLDLGQNEFVAFPDLSRCAALKQAGFGGNPLREIDPARIPASLELLDLTSTLYGRSLKESIQKQIPRLGVLTD